MRSFSPFFKINPGDTNVQADWNQTDTTADDYIKNKPTIPTQATSVASGDTGYTTGDQVYTALQSTGGDVWQIPQVKLNPGSNGYSTMMVLKNGLGYNGTLYVSGRCGNGGGEGTLSIGSVKFTNGYGDFNISSYTNNSSNIYFSFWIKETVQSSTILCSTTITKVINATSIASGVTGYTTGDQVYSYVNTALGNIETTLQSI